MKAKRSKNARYVLYMWVKLMGEGGERSGSYQRHSDRVFESHGALVDAYKKTTLRSLAASGVQFKIKRVYQTALNA